MLLLAEIAEGEALDATRAAQSVAEGDAEAHAFATRLLARIYLRHHDPENTLLTLEGDDHIDGLTIRALALAQIGETPPNAWMDAIRQRPATQDIPMYRERLNQIERALTQPRRYPQIPSGTRAGSLRA